MGNSGGFGECWRCWVEVFIDSSVILNCFVGFLNMVVIMLHVTEIKLQSEINKGIINNTCF